MSLSAKGIVQIQPNLLLNRYQLGDTLGKGAFGTVYRGLDVENGDFVAIKQISLHGIPKDVLKSIMSEIDLLKKLHHVNIVKYLGWNQTKEHLFIILEYVENGSLENVLRKFGKFPESLVGIYISQVLQGLVYLHNQGVIHRDIKAANILITKQGLVKVADFGVSTKLNEANDLANSTIMGSPYWMAPEIIELSGVSPQSDIWSVGCTVIELLTGAPPYFDLDPMPALFHIVEDECPPLPEGVSAALRDFLMQCFQKDPNLRVSAAKLLNHRWVKASAQRMQQKAAESAAAATPAVPALPSASSAPAVVPTIEIEPPAPLSLEGKFAPPPSGRQHSKSTGSSGSVTSRLPAGHEPHDRKNSVGSRSRSDDESFSAEPERSQDKNKSENEGKSERIRFDSKGSGKHHTRKEDRDKDRKRDDKKGDKDDKKSMIKAVKDARKTSKKASKSATSPTARLILEESRKHSRSNSSSDSAEDKQVKKERSKHRKREEEDKDRDRDRKKKKERKDDSESSRKKKERKRDEIDAKSDRKKSRERADKDKDRKHSKKDKKEKKEKKERRSEDEQKVSRTKSSRGLSGKSKSSRILSKVALKKADDKEHKKEKRKSEKRMSFDLGDDDLVAKLQNLGGGLRKSLKDFEEEDEEDWGDLVAQFSPKPKKGGRTAHAEEEEEWEKSLASRSKSTIVRPTHEHHKRRSAAKADLTRNFLGNDDEDWGDLTEQLNKKSGGGAKTAKSGNKDKDKRKSKGGKSKHNENAEDDENWDDLAKQLSPRGKNLQKVLQDFAESDEDADDWADLGKQLTGKDAASKDIKAPSSSKDKSSAIRKLGQFAEGDDDDDWGDLANQLSPRRRRTSSADPPRTKPVEEDDDDWGDMAASVETMSLSTSSSRSQRHPGGDDGDDFGDLASEGGELDLAAKLALTRKARQEGESVPATISDAEDDEDDPFGDEFDWSENESDMEVDPTKEELSKLTAEIMHNMSLLQHDQLESVIIETCAKLIEAYKTINEKYMNQKATVLRQHGVIPILEIIESASDSTALRILQLLNLIIEGNVEIKQNLCMMGGIPTIIKFADEEYSNGVRGEVGRFVREMCCGQNEVTLRMFIACRGLPVLASYAAANYHARPLLVSTAVDAVRQVFSAHQGGGSLPRNDFCRLFARAGLLPSLTSALTALANYTGLMDIPYAAITASPAAIDVGVSFDIVEAGACADKVADVLLIFSAADRVVKLQMATHVAPPVIALLSLVAPPTLTAATGSMISPVKSSEDLSQILDKPDKDEVWTKSFRAVLLGKLLKIIKSLAMDSRTLAAIASAGAMQAFVALLDTHHLMNDHFSQIVASLFYLCRLDPGRQEMAAKAGVIPHLQSIINSNSPLKQFVLPIVCQMAHSRGARSSMREVGGVGFLIHLIKQENRSSWPHSLMESIAAWLAEEMEVIEVELVAGVDTLVQAFAEAQPVGLSGMLEPLLKMLALSLSFTRVLAKSDVFVTAMLNKPALHHSNALVRVNILKILSALVMVSPHSALLDPEPLLPHVTYLASHDPSILVQEIASKLLTLSSSSSSASSSAVSSRSTSPHPSPTISRLSLSASSSSSNRQH